MGFMFLRGVLPEGRSTTHVSYVNPEPLNKTLRLKLEDVSMRTAGLRAEPLRATLTPTEPDRLNKKWVGILESNYAKVNERLRSLGRALRNPTPASKVCSRKEDFFSLSVAEQAKTSRVKLVVPPKSVVYTKWRYVWAVIGLGEEAAEIEVNGASYYGIENESEDEALELWGSRLPSPEMTVEQATDMGSPRGVELAGAREIELAKRETSHQLNFLRYVPEVTVELPPVEGVLSSARDTVAAALGPLLRRLENAAGLRGGTLSAADSGERVTLRSKLNAVELFIPRETSHSIGLGSEEKRLTLYDGVDRILEIESFPTANALESVLPIIICSSGNTSDSYMSKVGLVATLGYVGADYDVRSAPVRVEEFSGRLELSLYRMDYEPLTFHENIDIFLTFSVTASQ